MYPDACGYQHVAQQQPSCIGAVVLAGDVQGDSVCDYHRNNDYQDYDGDVDDEDATDEDDYDDYDDDDDDDGDDGDDDDDADDDADDDVDDDDVYYTALMTTMTQDQYKLVEAVTISHKLSSEITHILATLTVAYQELPLVDHQPYQYCL